MDSVYEFLRFKYKVYYLDPTNLPIVVSISDSFSYELFPDYNGKLLNMIYFIGYFSSNMKSYIKVFKKFGLLFSKIISVLPNSIHYLLFVYTCIETDKHGLWNFWGTKIDLNFI